MNSRDRVIKTLNHQPSDRVPRDLWILPGTLMFREPEVKKLFEKFPSDFAVPKFSYGKGEREIGTRCETPRYTDAWGCVWEVAQRGIIGEVKNPPIDDWSKLANFKPPWELLRNADLSFVNKSCSESDKFMLTGTQTRPFERLQFLRGSENVYIDLAYGTKELFTLIGILHDFFCAEMRMWAETDIDGISFMDDWGSQNSLLISPDMWRGIFKPLYKDYGDILHEKGKFVFFHTDGNIELIFPDLIEVGIDAVNSQLFCMDIEKLGEQYRSRITFWGEIDRQNVLPFGTVEDVRKA
ncbi:MAG TPA: methyltransferase, partial [Firmicutes bacterium]|nr:methyltransferase [Bacillota bacterium]